MNELSGTDWNAAAYDDLSDPMFEWGMALLRTLELKGKERLLDAGCGSGRLTEELLNQVPDGEVVALDFSPKMLQQARQRLGRFGGRAEFVHASLERFELAAPVDGIFSNAVFHWVADHEAMFHSLHRVLRPGGWLVAQFGGVGNLAGTYRRAHAVAGQPRFHEHLKSAEDDPNFGPHFEDVAATRERMQSAGFQVGEARLHRVAPRFERRERYEAFLETVVLRQPATKLPGSLRREFLEQISSRTWRDEGAYSLDYVRLTVRAQA